MLEAAPNIRIPDDELRFSFARSSGPGGQNVNKVNSKAILRWDVSNSPSLPADVRERFVGAYGSRITVEGEIVIVGERFRDQPKNIADCREKLRAMLAAVARPPKKRKKTKPSRAAKQRRLDSKKREGDKKRGRRDVRES